MEIKSLKDLDKLLKLCRKAGVATMKVGNMEFTLGKQAVASRSVISDVFPEANIPVPQYNPGNINESTEIETIQTDTLTEEQLMYYSARPEDPAANEPVQ